MNAFLSFALIPLIVGISLWLSPWLHQMMLPPFSHVSVPQLEPLAQTGNRETLLHKGAQAVEPPRLEALMPAGLIQSINPPPPPPRPQTAQDRYRLASVLLAPLGRFAVLNEQMVKEGGRIDEFLVRRVAADRVVLQGPQGQEVVYLESLAAPLTVQSLKAINQAPAAPAAGPVAQVVSTTPAASKGPQPPPPSTPAAELERQFRHLLERLSH